MKEPWFSASFREFAENLSIWMAGNWEKFFNFAVADRNAEARSGFKWRDADIMESVYSTLFLDKRKSGKFSIFVKNAANSRCLMDMYTSSIADAWASAIGVYAYSAWGFCKFARSTKMGNTRASVCGTSNKYGSHAFFIHRPCKGVKGQMFYNQNAVCSQSNGETPIKKVDIFLPVFAMCLILFVFLQQCEDNRPQLQGTSSRDLCWRWISRTWFGLLHNP